MKHFPKFSTTIFAICLVIIFTTGTNGEDDDYNDLGCYEDEDCGDGYKCSPVTKRCDCESMVRCRVACPSNFWVKDDKGCEICVCAPKCQNKDCPKGLLCSNVTNSCDCDDFGCPQSYCPNGFETDEKNCEVCICKNETPCLDCDKKTTAKNGFINWFKRKFGKK